MNELDRARELEQRVMDLFDRAKRDPESFGAVRRSFSSRNSGPLGNPADFENPDRALLEEAARRVLPNDAEWVVRETVDGALSIVVVRI